MYYVSYQEGSGDIVGIYPSTWNFDNVPNPKIAITDEQWEKLGSGYYIVQNGELVEVPYIEPKQDEINDNNSFGEEGVNEGNSNDPGISVEYLQTKYYNKFKKLKEAYVGASILGDTYSLTDIQRDYRKLIEEFTNAMNSLENEAAYEDVEHEHCGICGTRLEVGECQKCHWRTY